MAGDKPVSPRYGYDPYLLSVVLRLVHWQGDAANVNVTPEKLAVLTMISQVNGFTKALTLHIEIWFQKVQLMIQAPNDYGLLLLAAIYFNDFKFKQLSVAAIKNLTPGYGESWYREELMKYYMPEDVTCK